MGSNGTRFAVVTAAVAAVVALFVVLSGGNGEDETTTVASGTTTTEREATEEKPDEEKQEAAKPRPEPEVPTIEVRGGQPVGGVQRLEFESGERILFRIASDADAEFHLHGYDVEKGVAAGGEVTFDVPADVEGVFELEDHETLVPIAEITVSPS